jgi:hypothetical protein
MAAAPSKLEAQQLAAAWKWKSAHEVLKDAEAEEGKLRAEAVAVCFPGGLANGTTNLTLCDGSTLKGVVRSKAKVVAADKVHGAIARVAKRVGKVLANRLVRWVAEPSLAEIKKLDDECRGYLEGVIAVVAASPSLELQPAD